MSSRLKASRQPNCSGIGISREYNTIESYEFNKSSYQVHRVRQSGRNSNGEYKTCPKTFKLTPRRASYLKINGIDRASLPTFRVSRSPSPANRRLRLSFFVRYVVAVIFCSRSSCSVLFIHELSCSCCSCAVADFWGFIDFLVDFLYYLHNLDISFWYRISDLPNPKRQTPLSSPRSEKRQQRGVTAPNA